MTVSIHCRLAAGLFAVLAQLGGLGLPGRAVYPEIGPGIEYTHRQVGDGPMSVFVVKIDRSRKDLAWATTLAQGRVTGLSTVRRQTKDFSETRGEPVVAVNGDFFVIRSGPYQGDPRGLHIANGELISRPRDVNFWIDSRGKPHANRVVSGFQVAWPDDTTTTLRLNEERLDDGAALYTPTFGDSTRTERGREFVLERAKEGPWLPLRAGQVCSARVRKVLDSGDTRIESGRMVLSIGPKLAANLSNVETGQMLRLSLATTPDLRDVKLAIGGGPLLILNGKSQRKASPDEPRHPRTAIGWDDSHYFLVVVDGRQKGYSIGMTMSELAACCKRLGCTGAINLDGGGSSTLWLDGRVVNRPSDGLERRVANALVVYRTRQ